MPGRQPSQRRTGELKRDRRETTSPDQMKETWQAGEDQRRKDQDSSVSRFPRSY